MLKICQYKFEKESVKDNRSKTQDSSSSYQNLSLESLGIFCFLLKCEWVKN